MEAPIRFASIVAALARDYVFNSDEQPTPADEPRGWPVWREGNGHHPIGKGCTSGTASDVAAKLGYRSDLCPNGSSAPLQSASLRPTATVEQHLPANWHPTTAKVEALAPAVILPKRKTAPPTAREQRLVKTAAEIAAEPPGDNDRAYMHSIMCQVGLPRSEVVGTSFERHSGGAALLVEAGKLWDGKQFVQQPIPYGPKPRLMLAWMNTYAVRFNTAEIPVGDSASEFLRMLGERTSGGKRGAFGAVRKQVQALSACRITLGFNANGRAHTYDGKPIKHFEAWIAASADQRPLWPGTITFSEDYYQTLKAHAVPLDLRALIELKGSSLAMDAYTWLAQRLYRIEGRPVILYWKSLREQFAQEYEGENRNKDFRRKFLRALNAALAVYPKAKVKTVNGGVILFPSPPPIPLK